MQVFVVYMLFQICYWSSIGLIYKELLKNFSFIFPKFDCFFYTSLEIWSFVELCFSEVVSMRFRALNGAIRE